MTYGIYIWQCRPFAEDACCTGFDGFTLDEARAILRDPLRHAGLAETLSTMKGVEVWLALQVDVPDERIMAEWGKDKLLAERQYSAATAKPDVDEYETDRRERAMLAGMAFGCQGYNDAMGC